MKFKTYTVPAPLNCKIVEDSMKIITENDMIILMNDTEVFLLNIKPDDLSTSLQTIGKFQNINESILDIEVKVILLF